VEPSCAVDEVVARYALQRHPEGGFFREVYRSSLCVGRLPGYAGERTALTTIYFLLGPLDFSAFHRIRSEEVWVHLSGAPLELVLLEGKAPRFLRIAPVGEPGEPLGVVPSGVLQAARSTGAWSLAACVVAPGFDFADFELPSRQSLLQEYPGLGELIRRFTR
jgi:uncharacterized protein